MNTINQGASSGEGRGACAFADAVRILEQHWYTDEELSRWLNAAHPQFDGLSAISLLALGRKDEVLACVQRLDEGAYL